MLVAATLLGLVMLTAQDPVPAECEADDESEACQSALHVLRLRAFDVPTIEAEAATGAQVMRAFIVDGYGRDILLVGVEMRPDQPPAVVVVGPRGQRISEALSGAEWDRAVSGSVNADRLLSAVAPPEGEEIVCMHSWSARVEMANTRNANRVQIPVRIANESGCFKADGLALDYAFDLASIGVEAIPACAELDPDLHRNHASRLNACFGLRGNTVSAATLMNQKGEPPSYAYGFTPDADDWADWLATDSTGRLDWGGEVFEESNVFRSGEPRRPRMAEVMAERAASFDRFQIYQNEIGARDAENGWITGEIVVREKAADGKGRELVAVYRQEWSRGGGFGWRMDNWVVGPFQVLELPDE